MAFESIGQIAERVVEGVRLRHETVERIKEGTTTRGDRRAAVQLPTPSGNEANRRQVTEWEGELR